MAWSYRSVRRSGKSVGRGTIRTSSARQGKEGPGCYRSGTLAESSDAASTKVHCSSKPARHSRAFCVSSTAAVDVVGAAGIEPATVGLEIRCSIRLSYAPLEKIYHTDRGGVSARSAAGLRSRWLRTRGYLRHKADRHIVTGHVPEANYRIVYRHILSPTIVSSAEAGTPPEILIPLSLCTTTAYRLGACWPALVRNVQLKPYAPPARVKTTPPRRG